MDVLRFIIDDDQPVDFPGDHTQIDFGIICFSNRSFSQKVVFQIVVIKARLDIVSGIHAVDILQKEIASFADDGYIILNMQG